MKTARRILIGLVIFIAIGLFISAPRSEASNEASAVQPAQQVLSSEPVAPALSLPLSEIPSRKPEQILNREINPIRNPGLFLEDMGLTGSNTKDQDPLVALSQIDTGKTPAPLFTFEGLGTDGYTPPDTMGEVGPNHYVQMVNVSFAVYDKSGNILKADTLFTDLFAGSGLTYCSSQNDGDPVVVWDSLADRWLLSQFAVSTSPEHMCIAISQTPDPTGAYYLYQFQVPDFPDYFKFGVWPDAYYMGTNTGFPNQYYAYAFDRDAMLAGQPATYQYVNGYPNFLLPADLDGPTAPPVGSPGYFYTMLAQGYPNHPAGVDRVVLYEFDVDWDTPANSTFGIAQELPIADYNYTTCGFFAGDCIPQPGTTQKLDAVDPWPMWRFAYRNLGAYEALVGNFTVDTNGSDHAGIRWFELQKTGAADWDLHQEGTHSPDTDHRWMGSIAMDGSGNIALGYSVSSLTTYPSLRYASRLRGDTLGTLQAEATLYPGGGSQTGPYDRWGDYSSMSIDPADECTFWYTGEYHDTTADSFSWNTRIGKFRLPECTGSLGPDFTISATPAELAVCAPTSAVFNVNVNYMSGFNSTVNLSAASLPAGATANFVPTSVVTPTTQSILTIGTAGATAGSYDVEIIGTSVPTPTHSTIVGLDLFTASPAAPTLVAPADALTDVPLVPTFSWNGTAQAAEYYLQVATDSGFSNVVYSATVAGTSHTMTGMNLEAEETYYWRVRATNECGDSAYSTVYSFTTVLLFCSYPNAAITDNNTTLDTLTSSRNQPISDLNVYVQLTHTYIGDLDITLTNQATGSSVVLLPTSFTCSGDNIDATFDDEAGSAIVCGTSVPALSGDVRPSGSLGTFDYDALAGTWQIAVHDGVGGDVGTLAEWCLQPQFASGVGALAGTVTDANTTDPLAGVTLTVTDGSNSYNALTNAAGQYSRPVANGTYTVTAVLANYTTAQATGIAVTDGVTTTQDFALNAGIVTSSADDFAATLELATSTTLPWNLSNTGTAALDYDIRIIDGGYNPGRALQAGEDILVVASDTTAATAMETALTTLGFTYLRVTPTVFQSLTVPDLLAYKAVFHTGNTADASETLIMAYLDAGGVFYVSDNDLGYFNGTTVFYQTYLQATYVGDDPSINIIIGEDFMAGLSADISADPYPDHFTVRPEGTRILSFQGGNAAGVAVNRLGYKAVYTSFDYDDIASAADELAFMDAITGFLINTGDYWLSTDIEEGTLAVGADQNIVVTMDANNVALAGTYYADLLVQNNTPYEDIVIPVTMTVTCPTCGTLDGEITDDFTGDPLVASVQITSTGGFDYTIDGSAYSIALPPGAYYLSVSAPDYLPETAVATVTQGTTTTTDFALTPAFAALVYDPAAIEETMEIGDVVTNTVTVTNTGTIDLDFDVNIGGFGGPGLLSVQKVESSTAVNIPADDGKFERGTAAPSIEKAPVNAAGSSAATKSLNQLLGTISYATDVGLTQFVSVDLATPGSPTNIAAFTNSIWAGDIANGLVYAIDDVTTNLITIDTATGAPTVVGSTGNANTTGMAYDPVTGNMYVSDVTTCGTSSRLHTINLSTGTLTLIGTVTNSPCLIGIAANSAGQLYGYDIVNDTLLSIDKATGAGTVIGSLGFDANFAQGMGFDAASGQMYLAAFNNLAFQAELRIADLATGNTTLVGAFGTSGTSQYGWLAIPGLGSGGSGNWATTPFEGATVAPGETATFEVVFDATSLYQVGTYTADLSFSGNFINDVPDMPLTMHLSCPTCGILDGSITDGDTGDPLVADVHVTGPNGFDVTVSGDSYQLAVSDGDYDFTVSAAGYFSQTATVEATTGVTVTTDFALRLAQPNISVDPTAFDVTLALGETTSLSLDIINDGALGTNFTLSESPASLSIITRQPSAAAVDAKYAPVTAGLSTPLRPLSPQDILLTEGFEGGAIPPADWDTQVANAAYSWKIMTVGTPYSGSFSADVEYDPSLAAQDEWLLSPEMMLTEGTLSFWSLGSVYWCRDTFDNCDLNVWLVVGATAGDADDILVGTADDDWSGNFIWAQSSFDLAPYLPSGPVRIGFQYVGSDGAQAGLDEIILDGVEGSLDVPWLSTNPITGTVAADSTETVNVIFDTTVLTQTGVYNAVLKVLTGDPTNPTINIPVTLTVIDSESLVYLPIIAKP